MRRNDLGAGCRIWVIRDLVVPSGEFARLARLAALKTEINSEHLRHIERLLWVDGAAGDVFQALKLEAWIERYELSDFEWAAIKPSWLRRGLSAGRTKLPNSLHQPGPRLLFSR
jgi:hypothetical protein